MAKPRLCLGTAQFGQIYGITNQESAINEEKACKILELAYKENIYDIDTALCYGRSQEIIGKANKNLDMNITSKIKIGNNDRTKSTLEEKWDHDLEDILAKLNINTLNALLIHDTESIEPEKAEIFSQWATKKKEGWQTAKDWSLNI